MKTRKLLIFLLCFVLLVGALAVVASAKGATTVTSAKETTNSDGTVVIAGYEGKLASKYASKDSYPFAVFKYKNGAYDSAEGSVSMGAALNIAKTWNTKNTPDGAGYKGDIYTATIVMRKNYTTVNKTATPGKDSTDAPGDKFDNYAQNEGLITLDLNGYTLTQKDTAGVFTQVTTKGSSSQGYIFSTEYTVKNGNIALNTNPVFYGNMWNSVYGVDGYSMADKNFTWNFENVNFSYVSGANETSMLMAYTGPQSTSSNPPEVAAPFYFNYTDCTFDLTFAPAGTVTLFNAAPTEAQWLKVAVTVNGCEIKVPGGSRLSAFKLFSLETKYGSSVTFNPGENGDALKLTVVGGDEPVIPTSSTYVNIDGKQLYWHKAEGNSYVLTECDTDAHACSCGTIYTDCVDENADNVCDLCGATNVGGTWVAAANNFAIVDADGKFSSVQYTFKAAMTAAAKINGSTIVMLNDYVNTTVDASNNLKALSGEISIDLNGHTLTRGYNGSYLFDNWFDASTTADSVKITFKNGTLNAEKWLICLSGNNAIANEKQVDFAFENVTFKFAANNDKTDGWVIVVHNQTYNKQITSNITITNCTVDTTDMRSSLAMDKTPVINLAVNNKDGVDYVKATVTVDGLTIVGNRFVTKSLVKVHADDTVTMSNLTLVMPNGTAPTTPAEADYFVVNGEKVYFHATTVGETETTYTLTACAAVDGTHNCSCGVVMSTCADNTSDHKCDVCGKTLSECVDEGKDHVCDVCGETSECLDENKDHICELCDKTTPCEDNNNDHLCDTCNKVLTVCVDDDKNHACDICEATSTCDDANNDGKCDVCGLYKYDLGKYGIFWLSTNYSVSEYPFFVLMYQNGVYTFNVACRSFYANQGKDNGTVKAPGAMDKAIYGINGYNKYDIENGVYVPEGSSAGITEAVIVARRDYDLKMGSSSTANTERHDNMAHMQGTVTLDLNGHTLREAEGSNKSILTITIKGWTGAGDKVFTFPSTLNIKNGSLEVRDYEAVKIASSDGIEATEGWTIANSEYTVNFDGVTFCLAEGAETTTLAYTSVTSSNKYSGIAKSNVTFTNCVFDLTNNTGKTVQIVNGTDHKDVDDDVVINGCVIKANDMSGVAVYNFKNLNGSTISVNKNLTLVMPEGATAPALTNTVTLENGVVCSFVKSAAADGNVTYTLYPSVMVDYKIKTSVTLYSNFVYNIYVPAANVQGITVNGAAVEYTTETINGVEYYLVKVNLPAGETLENIALAVTLTSGETTVDAKWTLSVVNYTKAVLGGDYNDTTKTLMKDMLVYASAAHTYFENTEAVADKLAEIKTLLGDYEAAVPTGEAKTTAGAPYFTEVAVSIGAVPSFKFTLAEGYTADNFTFTVGGKEATVITGDGYLEVVMYAYMMLEDVTYVVNGTDATGTYNLYSYYNFVNGLEGEYRDEDLITLTAALIKYSVSAKAYRDYIVNETCQHDYADGKCVKCGEEDPDKGSLSLTAPASIYTNYAGKDITANFTKAWYKGEITYTTSHPNVFVENGKIFATGDFASATDVTVTATTEHHTASVVVNVSQFDGGVSAEKKVQWYENNIIKEENKGGMIFVGDSFFDGASEIPSFWRDFYQDYAGEKAFLMGISSSQIDDLEVVSERIVYPMEPSEIVVHIGFNDVHSGNLPVDELIARITALLTEYHNKLPNTKVYFIGVEPKKTGYESDSSFYESSTVKAPAVTKAMQDLAAANDWFVFVDTLDIFVGKDGKINKNMYMLTDQSHPTLYAYDLIRFAINEARGVANDTVKILDQDATSSDITGDGYKFTDANGNQLTNATGDYVVSGKLAITSIVKNAHIQFRFKSGARFLFWDKDGDGLFTTDVNGTGAEKYDATTGSIIVEWAVVVKDNKAYLYIDGNLECELADVSGAQYFNIGAMKMDVTFYDLKLSIKAEDEAAYNEHMVKYDSDRFYIQKLGNSDDPHTSGETYTIEGDYVMTGTLEMYKLTINNAYIEFRFNNSYRFLLWDNDKDGLFGAGYTENGTNVSDKTVADEYYAKSGIITLDWAIVVKDGTAYFYIDGVLKKTFTGTTYGTFNIGAVQMNILFYNIELYTVAENPDAYNKKVSEYLN